MAKKIISINVNIQRFMAEIDRRKENAIHLILYVCHYMNIKKSVIKLKLYDVTRIE